MQNLRWVSYSLPSHDKNSFSYKVVHTHMHIDRTFSSNSPENKAGFAMDRHLGLAELKEKENKH